jgi:hypothetical protein
VFLVFSELPLITCPVVVEERALSEWY